MDNSFDSLLNASAVPQDEKVQAFIAESMKKLKSLLNAVP